MIGIVEKVKLFDAIPYIEAYANFHQCDDIIDVNAMDIDVPPTLWAFYIRYASQKYSPFLLSSSVHVILESKKESFGLSDDNIKTVTMYASYMSMVGFLQKLRTYILCDLSSFLPSQNPLFKCIDEKTTRSYLQYFVFLVEYFSDSDQDCGLIDAMATSLASQQVWNYAQILAQELKFEDIFRFVRRNESHFGPERNVYNTVIAWCNESRCPARGRIQLLLAIPLDCDSLERDIDGCIMSLIAQQCPVRSQMQFKMKVCTTLYAFPETYVDAVLVKQTSSNILKDLRKRYKCKTVRQDSWYFNVTENSFNVMNRFNTSSRTFALVNTSKYILTRERKRSYCNDFLLSDNGRWLFVLMIEPRDFILVQKVNIVDDVNKMGWTFVGCEPDIYNGNCYTTMQLVQMGKFLIANKNGLAPYVFHQDGHWELYRSQLRESTCHSFRLNDVVPTESLSVSEFCYCVKQSDAPYELTIYAISKVATGQLYKMRVKVNTWDRKLCIGQYKQPWKNIDEPHTSVDYPDIKYNTTDDLPTLFFLPSIGLTCISELHVQLLKSDENICTYTVLIDCHVADETCGFTWTKRQLKSLPWTCDRRDVNDILLSVCKNRNTVTRRPLKGRYDAYNKCLTLFSGDALNRVHMIFKFYDVVIDFENNTIDTFERSSDMQYVDGMYHGC